MKILKIHLESKIHVLCEVNNESTCILQIAIFSFSDIKNLKKLSAKEAGQKDVQAGLAPYWWQQVIVILHVCPSEYKTI
jgi:hypothetical protein